VNSIAHTITLDEHGANGLARIETGEPWPAFMVEDPLATLPDVARRLLGAAKRIIVDRGLAALTLSAVGKESGENTAMIAYYFGNKAGLVEAVSVSLIYEEYAASMARLIDLEPPQRAAGIIEEMRRLTEPSDRYRVYFELLPQALRDESLRGRLKELHRWFFAFKLEWFRHWIRESEVESPELQGLLDLLAATIDGLAIQDVVGREGYSVPRALEVFRIMLEKSLPSLLVESTELDSIQPVVTSDGE
jgi:AcrR family transcriptional regulator